MRGTLLVLVVNVAVYVLMLVDGGGALGGFDGRTLVAWGASYAPAILEEGEAWRVLTATLVHLNVMHIAMNMLALLQAGGQLEARWGAARLVVAYLVTGLGGSLVSLAWHADGETVSAGASGAICGLIGAAIVAFHRSGGEVAHHIRNAMLRWAAIIVALGLLSTLMAGGGGIDNAAHVGGLGTGLLLGLVVEAIGVRRRTGLAADLVAMTLFVALAAGAFALARSSTLAG